MRNEIILKYYKYYKEVNGNIMTTDDMGSCLLCNTPTEGGGVLLCKRCMSLLDDVSKLSCIGFMQNEHTEVSFVNSLFVKTEKLKED